MRVFKYLIVILSVAVFGAGAEGQIELEGTSPALRKKLVRTLATIEQSGKKAAAESLLADAGYLEVRAEWLVRDGRSILNITPGDLFRLENIILEGDRHDTTRAVRPFNQENIETLIDSLLALERERGYYYASLAPHEIRKNGSALDIIMKEQRGPCLTVSTVDLHGLRRTRPEFLRRYIDLRAGDTLRPSEMARLARRLGRLGFVSLTGPPEISPEAGYEQAAIRLFFTEPNTFRFEGGGGYIPDDAGYFLWFLNLHLVNLFGRGQELELNFDRREKEKSLFSVSHRRPVFWLGMGTAGIEIATRDYRQSFYEFSLKVDYRFGVADKIELGFGVEGRDVEPSLGPGYRVIGAGVEGRWGEIPDFYSPSWHSAVTWEVRYQTRHYSNSGDTIIVPRRVSNETRSLINWETTLGIVRPLAVCLRGAVQDIKSSEITLPAAELILFGGSGSLRGYRQDQFSARRLALVSLEERWYVAHNSYLYPFFDLVYYEFDRLNAEGAGIRDSDILNGFGLGISLISGNRRLRWEFAWSEGVSLDQPRLHIMVSDRF